MANAVKEIYDDAQLSASGEELLQRARDLAPLLSERALESEKLRHLAPASSDALRDAGLYKLYAPVKYGGYGLTPLEAVRIYAEVARNDGAAAWVTMIMSTNSWMAAQFPESVQEKLYADGDIRIVGVIGGGGGKSEAKPVDGGYMLSGFWPFCSGCHHAKWVMLGAVVPGPDGGEPEPRLFVVPQEELTIKDDWHTMALAGSGSNSVTCKDLFVPGDMMLNLMDIEDRDAKDPLYQLDFVTLFSYQLIGPALGFARAAIEQFRERAPKKGISYTFYEKQSEAAIAQYRLGEAMVKLEAATALAERDLAKMMDEALVQPSLLERGQRRANASYIARLCLEAVETVYLVAGASSIHESNPLQRIARDIHADNMHGALALDTTLELLGRLSFGLEPNTAVI